MNIGALELQLMMTGLDKVQSDMASMKGTIGEAMGHIESSVNLAKNAFGTLLGVSSVSAFAGMINGSINATAALKDMATQTGASEAALGQFRSIGTYTETSIDSITGAMGKLSKNLINNTEDSKGAGVAIKALGLDFETIRSMKPEDQMLAIAGAMNQFEDGTNKSAAAQALWGKEGAALLPFIKDLGDQVGQVSEKLSDNEVALKKNQAAMADAFGDNLTQIRKESDAWKRDLATGMTPALYEASQAFLDVTTSAGGIRGQISALSKDGSITEWTRGAITGVTYLMDAFSGLGAVAKSAGILMGGMVAAVTSGDWDTMKASIKLMGEELDRTWSEKTLGAQLRERMADLKGVSVEVDTNKGKMGDVRAELEKAEAARKREAEAIKAQEKAAREHNAELKKQEDQYNKLSASLAEKLTAMNTELETGVKLTDGQKLEIKFLEDLRTGNVKFTADQTIATMAKIEEIKQTELLVEERKREKKQTDENNAAMQASIEKMFASTESIREKTIKLQAEKEEIGLNSTQMAELTRKRNAETIAIDEEKAAILLLADPNSKMAQQYLDQASAIGELQAAMDAVEWAKTTKAIGDGVSSSLISSIKSGKDAWVGLRDYFVTTFVESKIKDTLSGLIQDGLNATGPAIQTFMGDVKSGIGDLFSGAFSSIKNAISSKDGDSMFGSFGDMFSSAADSMGSIFGSAWDALSGLFGGSSSGSMSSSLGDMFSSAADSMSSIFGSAWDALSGLFGGSSSGSMSSSLGDMFSSAADSMGSIFGSAWDALSGLFGGSSSGSMSSSLGDMFSSAADSMGSMFSSAWDALSGLFGGSSSGSMSSSLGDMFSSAADSMSSVFGSAWDALSGLFGGSSSGSMSSSLDDMFSSAADSMSSVFGSAFSDLTGSITSMFTTLFGSISSTFGGLISSIGSSLSSLLGGASSGASALTGGSSGIVSSIAGGATDLVNLATGGGFGTGGSILGGGSAAGGASVTGAAAGGGSSLASVGAYVPGAVALLGAAYIASSMFAGPSETWTEVGQGQFDYTGPFGTVTSGNADNPDRYTGKAGDVVRYSHQTSTHSGDAYALSVAGHDYGAVHSLAEIPAWLAQDHNLVLPAYASGGDFAGGLRIVGENGPELEATGPSRIFDAATTASMLRSGGANDAEVVQELRLLRRALEQTTINTAATQKTLDRIAPGGDAMSVRVVT